MTGAAGDEPSEPADVAEAEDRDEDDDEEPRPQIEVHAFRHLIDAQNNKREWRKFPSMVRLAIRLVWSASASRATFTTVVSLVTSLGVGVQLLFGNSLLGRALVLRAAGGDLVTLAPRAIAFAVLSVSLALLTAASDVQSKVLGDMVGARTYDHVLDTAGAVGLTRFEDSKFYDDLQKATFGAQFQPSSIVSSLVSLLSAVVGAASISVALVSLQPALLGLVLLGAIPVWIAARRNAQTQIRVFGEETPEARERGYLRSVLTDRIAAKEIRAFGLVRPLRVRHDVLTMSILTRSRKSAFEQARRRLLAQGAGGVTSGLAGALLLALLVDGRIAVAAAVTATLAVQQVRGRVTGGASAVGTMYSSALFLESYADFMSIPPERDEPSTDPVPIAPFQRLAAEAVTFAYPGAARPSLLDVDVEIRAGEIIALVGENGSGKTTLAKVLCGLYEPSGGAVTWDGADLATLDPAAVRQQLTVIFQDFVRYSLTLRENITLGRPEAAEDEERMLRAAGLADVSRIAARLDDGFDTRLGREFGRSLDLSGGQWQRVALARAFFRDAPFLVLDEPTAALDARAEHDLFQRIRALAAGRSVLLITHRFGNVRSADRIYVLHRGKVVEQGSHDDLMSQHGRYADLFTLQASAYLDPTSPPA